jgi:hypothetical protein
VVGHDTGAVQFSDGIFFPTGCPCEDGASDSVCNGHHIRISSRVLSTRVQSRVLHSVNHDNYRNSSDDILGERKATGVQMTVLKEIGTDRRFEITCVTSTFISRAAGLFSPFYRYIILRGLLALPVRDTFS